MKRLPIILTGLYLALLVISVIPIFTGDDALSGVFAVLLAAPWTMLFGSLFESSDGSITKGLALISVGGLINAALIFLFSRWLAGKIAK